MKIFWLLFIFALMGCASAPPPPPPKVEPTVLPINEKWLEEIAGEHNHDVLKCYQTRLKSKPKLEGEMHLEFAVSPVGELKDLKLTKSVDPRVDKCVTDVATGWRFPWNVRNGTTDTAMTDTFRLYLENSQPRSEFHESQLGMDKEAIRLVVKEHLKDVRGCYSDRLRSSPGLVGKVVLEWEIETNGFAHAVVVKKSLDETLDECLIKKLKTWQFPIPAKGMVGRVDFPFIFTAE